MSFIHLSVKLYRISRCVYPFWKDSINFSILSSLICSFFQLILIQIFEFFVYLFDCQVSFGSALVRLYFASPSRDALAIKLNVTRALPVGASRLVGLDGLEPSTSRLSGARSSHLSYRPFYSKANLVQSTLPCLPFGLHRQLFRFRRSR